MVPARRQMERLWEDDGMGEKGEWKAGEHLKAEGGLGGLSVGEKLEPYGADLFSFVVSCCVCVFGLVE